MKIFLLFTFLIFYSCNSNVSSILNVKEIINFNVGFNPESRFTGSFLDKISGKEIIYFAEPITRKVIKFYDIKGKIQDSTSLIELSKATSRINSLKVISKDTILFFNFNQIIAVNRYGKIWKRIDLKELTFNDKSNNIFDFNDSFKSNNEVDSKNIILGLNWVSNKNNRINKNNFSYKDYFISSFNNPSIIKLNDYLTDSISYKYSNQNHYKSLFDKPQIFSEGFNYRQINGKIYIISYYSNNILVFDKDKLKVINKFEILSNFTNIGNTPFDANADVNKFSGEKAIIESKSAGAIVDIFYFQKNKIYYVIVRHEIDIEDVSNEKDRKFSLIKYDNFFKKISEAVINDNIINFFGYNMIKTDIGLMILNKKNTNDKNLSFSIIQ